MVCILVEGLRQSGVGGTIAMSDASHVRVHMWDRKGSSAKALEKTALARNRKHKLKGN